MSPAVSVYIKELRGQFFSLTAYVFTVVFLVTSNWLFFQSFFLFNQASLRTYFDLLPWYLLLLVPAVSMRTWAEEKRQGTAELLLTLPIPEWQVVVAKFAANATFLAAALAFSLTLPLTVARLGDLDWGPVIGGYLGAWLFGCAYLAMGQWISGLTSNQIVAFLATIAASFALLVSGISITLASAGPLSDLLYRISTYTHFQSIAKGVLDLRDIVYFLSLIGLFLYLNVYTLVRRHWR
ncbi:MAG: ABC-2 type transport system permease protein [Parcubacteria group bacterium Gr01-1014_31]|nr:MAG: ABC-2 type transport system permease protein [Parcubacteria group bacterium Gr01-1014_31]